jgi:SAM-dependent methyltransferase
MKNKAPKPDKEIYRQLRTLPWAELWSREKARFDQGSAEERRARVAVVRAVGVVFAESGQTGQRQEVRRWLLNLLHDPCEKARRYAMAALPKIGAAPEDEAQLISVLRAATSAREKKFAGLALEKVGGPATLNLLKSGGAQLLPQTGQKVKARLARAEKPSAIRLENALAELKDLRIHLRTRRGLEVILREEVEASAKGGGKFHPAETSGGLVAVTPTGPFTLGDVLQLRCFGSVGFLLGHVPLVNHSANLEGLAGLVASVLSLRILRGLTEGEIRYRLNYVAQGHQRGAVRQLASRIYALCPEILNDGRKVTWTVDIFPVAGGHGAELRPNLTPDPRFLYRQADVPAASHPPLAASLARFAGRVADEVVWDPFCGSGLELIESALLGGVRQVYGTDHDPAAIAISRGNFAAAKIKAVPARFIQGDFRDFARLESMGAGDVTLIITNPPMGKRVPIPELARLIEDLFDVAAKLLKPGGRLVFANPLLSEQRHPLLQLQDRQPVDFGGFECRLERHLKLSG